MDLTDRPTVLDRPLGDRSGLIETAPPDSWRPDAALWTRRLYRQDGGGAEAIHVSVDLEFRVDAAYSRQLVLGR